MDQHQPANFHAITVLAVTNLFLQSTVHDVWRALPIRSGFPRRIGEVLIVRIVQFASGQGATSIGELPAHVDAFVEDQVARHHERTSGSASP